VDAADLDYRTRTFTGCIPPDLVTRLVELGHADEVALQAGCGEWFCALAWARLLAEQDRQAEPLEVLAPYVATGWWKAAQATGELLEGWGHGEEAITLARPYAQAGDRLALVFFARLLARRSRGDEAFELLRPRVEDWYFANALVEVAEIAGRDEDAAVLLVERIEAGPSHQCDTPSCSRREIDPSNAVDLLAGIRERQGRIDEAIALLHTRRVTSVNNRDQLADLLARHNRIDELRAYAEADYHGHAAQRLAELLEERGDVDGAIEAYRNPGNSPLRQDCGAVELARLLGRHGRGEEATEVLRSLADSPGGAEDWIVGTLCIHYAEQGRPEDGLAYLDTLNARYDGAEDWTFFRLRLTLMAACGRREEAIKQAQAHPEADTWYGAWAIADLLADAGRVEQAVEVLQRQGSDNSSILASYLIDLGRIKEAVAVLQQRDPTPTRQLRGEGPTDEPPF
jgi:tetratricopeptide (TPR) repeat protein